VAAVNLAAGGVRLKPCVERLAGDLAHQHHRIGNRAVGPVGVRHAVQSDRSLIQVALPVDARGVDELLVIGRILGRLQIFVEEGARRLEVDVDNAVRLWQQARGLGRGYVSQEDGHGQNGQDRGQYPERSAGALVHRSAVRDKISPRSR
jgi:hypothetical protein